MKHLKKEKSYYPLTKKDRLKYKFNMRNKKETNNEFYFQNENKHPYPLQNTNTQIIKENQVMGLWTKMGLIEVERDRSKLRPKLRVIKGRG